METFHLICAVIEFALAGYFLSLIVSNIKDRYYDLMVVNVIGLMIALFFGSYNLYDGKEQTPERLKINAEQVQIDTIVTEKQDTTFIIRYIK